MDDLFATEQEILQKYKQRLLEIPEDGVCSRAEMEEMVNGYARILRQLRTLTRLSDRTTENLYSAKQDLMHKVHYDALTGIFSRRYLNEKLADYAAADWNNCETMFCVMMVDVDFFKKYNDVYGHLTGDTCLRAVADALASKMRESDGFVARYGGEEFAVVLVNTDENTIGLLAERLRRSVEEKNIPHKKSSVSPYVTVSIGYVTGILNAEWKPEEYFDTADKALYHSKQNGRNQVTRLKMGEVPSWS